MDRRSTHHHPALNSIPKTHLPTNIVAPIKRENDSDDDDVLFLATVPKVSHTPEEYDPECNCSTCRMVTKLLAECTCGECRGHQSNDVNQKEEQAMRKPNDNATNHNEVSLPYAKPSKTSIQNNDASTSEQISGNDRDDRSRSPTPDYVPRIFDNESEGSSSDDSEGGDHIDNADDMELDQESESEDEDRSDTFSKLNSSKSLSPLKKSSYVKPIDSNIKIKCPSCNQSYTTIASLKRHYRMKHQLLKPYYCKWPKCEFVTGRSDVLLEHITLQHLDGRKNANNAKVYVGKRNSPKDPIIENLLKSTNLHNNKSLKSGRVNKKIYQTNCPQCKRTVPESHLEMHLRAHKNPGFRCNWFDCGFFFSQVTDAKKHVCVDHLQVETANSAQINRHLVKVNPVTGKTCKVQVRAKRTTLKASDHHSRPSTSGGSRLVSVTNLQTTDGQANSSENESDDNEKDMDNGGKTEGDSTSNQVSSFNCPKCGRSFIKRNKLLRHYRTIHLQFKPYYCKWPNCNVASDIFDRVANHANWMHFNSADRKRAKSYVGKRKMSSSQKEDPIYESLRMMVKPDKNQYQGRKAY